MDRQNYIEAVKYAYLNNSLKLLSPFLYSFYREKGGIIENEGEFLSLFYKCPAFEGLVKYFINIMNIKYEVIVVSLGDKFITAY